MARKPALVTNLKIAETFSPVKRACCIPFEVDRKSVNIPPVKEPRKVVNP